MSRARKWLPIILVLPWIATCTPPIFNRIDPSVGGFPFFYVWLAGWVVMSSILLQIVHRWWRP